LEQDANIVLNGTMYGAERAILFPKLEQVLQSFGFGGKSCLLRAVCEVHEFSVWKEYGVVGEILTSFFK